jgi:hypothetical protein
MRFKAALPEWIKADRSIKGIGLTLLLTIADECPTVLRDGSRVGARSGKGLIREVGCSDVHFRRLCDKMEAHGYLVCVSRGGVVRDEGEYVSVPNVWGIPALRGALDGMRAQREKSRMTRSASGGWHRRVIRKGSTPRKPDAASSVESVEHPKPMNAAELRAAEYILAHPGKPGSVVAEDTHINYDSFRKRITKRLQAFGFTNTDGWRAPGDAATCNA